MLKSVKKAPPLRVVAENCNGCGLCMKIGCPALTLPKSKGVVEIDRTQCVGCRQCMQMCHRDALVV